MDTVNQILEVDSVILEFGNKRVLQDVYVKCQANSIAGLLGRNGAGKTCLMNIIFGKLKPQNGTIRINKKALLGSKRNPKDLMYLPQFNFIPKFLSLKRIFEDFKLDFDAFLLDFPEFRKYDHSKFETLSGGERRIVEIWLILFADSRFCLLDEPFSHIMPLHIDKIKELIRCQSTFKGIMVTDHMYKHIIEICDTIYVIKDGKTHLIDQLKDIEFLEYAKIKD